MMLATVTVDLDTPEGRAAMGRLLADASAAAGSPERLPATGPLKLRLKDEPTPADELPSTGQERGADVEPPQQSSQANPEAKTATHPAGDEPDWNVMVARVLAGERLSDVAATFGVPWRRLNAKVSNAKHQLSKAPVSKVPPADAGDPEDDGPDLGGGEDEVLETEDDDEEDPLFEDLDDDRPRPAPPPRVIPTAAERDETWSPKEDVAIIGGYTAGQQAWQIAGSLDGRKPADVVNRFRALVPVPGITNQAAALKRAEARLAARE